MPDTLTSLRTNAWPTPPDLSAGESDVEAWMAALDPVEPPALLGARVLRAAPPARRGGTWVALLAVAAVVLIGIGLGGFSHVAAQAAEAGCAGARCAGPIVAVVDDPEVPLYQSLEALAAFDGEGGCWEALADLGGIR